MSINAISSVSLYEYYYTINDSGKRKPSPLEGEMRKYGLVPTDNEQVNAAMLRKAKEAEKTKKRNDNSEDKSYSNRPWADIMYQLNISFNDNPADDIADIKEKLSFLLDGIKDEELEDEIKDLEDYVERLYVEYEQLNIPKRKTSVLTSQLNNLSVINRAALL